MSKLRQKSRNASELLLVDPEAMFDSLMIKNSVQPKKAGSRTVQNVKSQISAQRTNTLKKPVGCDDKCSPFDQERLAVTLSFSGSTASKAEMDALVADVLAAYQTHKADLHSGFLPEVTTSPAFTLVV